MIPLISASLLFRAKKVTESEQMLKEYQSSLKSGTDSTAVRVRLSLAQIYLSQNNLRGLLETLKSIEPLQHKPGLISTLLALHEQLEDIEGAIRVLNESDKWWETQVDRKAVGKLSENSEYTTFLKMSAEFKFRNRYYMEAAAVYSKLLEVNPKDAESLASTYSVFQHTLNFAS